MACFATGLFGDNDELLLGKVKFLAFAVGAYASSRFAAPAALRKDPLLEKSREKVWRISHGVAV